MLVPSSTIKGGRPVAKSKGIQKMFHIDYGTLGEEDKIRVHNQFLEECISRINVITAIVFFGESIITVLDFLSGFYNKHPLNRLNLIGEILIIVSSFITNAICNKLVQKDYTNHKARVNLLLFYKVTLLIGASIFIATDIIVRHKTIGAYIVLLFVFQILPFFKARENMAIYGFFAVFISALYLLFVPNAKIGTLFSVLSIIFAFVFSTECMRSYSIKKNINNRMNELMTERFSRLATQTIMALSNAVEAKDQYTQGHSQRVATYSKELAKRMGYSAEKLNEIYYIGLLHDIGKLGVDDAVINKKGRLTDEEFAEIKKHPEIGYDILKIITEIPDISIGAKYHHEKMNGFGYPDGLNGDEIPKIAQIIAVADAYDAMTSNRSYREVMPQEKVRSEIEKNSGTQFAPEVAEMMLQMIDEDDEYAMHA